MNLYSVKRFARGICRNFRDGGDTAVCETKTENRMANDAIDFNHCHSVNHVIHRIVIAY